MDAYWRAANYLSVGQIFSDYMRPAIRLAALMRLRVAYVSTHDSIAIGQDGPSHQPVAHLGRSVT